MNIHWKDWCWSQNSNTLLLRKDPDVGKDWRQEEKGMIEDEMVGWHHQLDGHEFEQASGVGDGQGSLCAAFHMVAKSWTRVHDWTVLNCLAFVSGKCWLHKMSLKVFPSVQLFGTIWEGVAFWEEAFLL